MTLFKFFFRQFSFKLDLEAMCEVSLKFVERLRRKMMNKHTEIQKIKCFLYIGFSDTLFSDARRGNLTQACPGNTSKTSLKLLIN